MVCPGKLSEIDISKYEVVKRSNFIKENTQESSAIPVLPTESDGLMIFDYERPGTVTFSKECLEAIGDPEYVLLTINLKRRVFLLVKVEKEDKISKRHKPCRVERDEEGSFVCENSYGFLSRLAEEMRWHPGSSTKMLFSGEAHGDRIAFFLDDVIMFNTGDVDELVEFMANEMADQTSV